MDYLNPAVEPVTAAHAPGPPWPVPTEAQPPSPPEPAARAVILAKVAVQAAMAVQPARLEIAASPIFARNAVPRASLAVPDRAPRPVKQVSPATAIPRTPLRSASSNLELDSPCATVTALGRGTWAMHFLTERNYKQALLLGSLQRPPIHLAGIMQSMPAAATPQACPSLAKDEQRLVRPVADCSHFPARHKTYSPT